MDAAEERDGVDRRLTATGLETVGPVSPRALGLRHQDQSSNAPFAERPDQTGIHHIAGGGSCSWNELALEVFERAGIGCRVLPATGEQFLRPARRPAYSVLGTERRDPLVLPRWQDGVAEYLATRVTV